MLMHMEEIYEQAEKSLINGITLMIKGGENYWAEVFEIDECISKGFEIFNEIKRNVFEKKRKKIQKEIKRINKLNKAVG